MQLQILHLTSGLMIYWAPKYLSISCSPAFPLSTTHSFSATLRITILHTYCRPESLSQCLNLQEHENLHCNQGCASPTALTGLQSAKPQLLSMTPPWVPRRRLLNIVKFSFQLWIQPWTPLDHSYCVLTREKILPRRAHLIVVCSLLMKAGFSQWSTNCILTSS